jgi:hypothetical protein
MVRRIKKMTLGKETVRMLSGQELQGVAGAFFWTMGTYCTITCAASCGGTCDKSVCDFVCPKLTRVTY